MKWYRAPAQIDYRARTRCAAHESSEEGVYGGADEI